MAKVTGKMMNEAMLAVSKSMQPERAESIQRQYDSMSPEERMQMNAMSDLLATELNKRLAS